VFSSEASFARVDADTEVQLTEAARRLRGPQLCDGAVSYALADLLDEVASRRLNGDIQLRWRALVVAKLVNGDDGG